MSKEPTFIQITDEHLRKIFRREKSRDLKQSQFEAEKTARIQAIASALPSTEGTDRQKLIHELLNTCNKEYPIDVTLF
jgi:hypothetical protein